MRVMMVRLLHHDPYMTDLRCRLTLKFIEEGSVNGCEYVCVKETESKKKG